MQQLSILGKRFVDLNYVAILAHRFQFTMTTVHWKSEKQVQCDLLDKKKSLEEVVVLGTVWWAWRTNFTVFQLFGLIYWKRKARRFIKLQLELQIRFLNWEYQNEKMIYGTIRTLVESSPGRLSPRLLIDESKPRFLEKSTFKSVSMGHQFNRSLKSFGIRVTKVRVSSHPIVWLWTCWKTLKP